MARSKLRIHMVLASLQAHTDLSSQRALTAQASHQTHTDLNSQRALTTQASHRTHTDLSSQRALIAQASHRTHTDLRLHRTRMAQVSPLAPTALSKLGIHMARSKLRTHMAHASLQAPMVTSSQRVPTVPASLQTPTNQRDHQVDTVRESHQHTAPSKLSVIYPVVSPTKTCLNPIHTTCSTKNLHRLMVAIRSVNRASHRPADTVHHRLHPLRRLRTPSRLAPRPQTDMLAPTLPQATNPHRLATAAVTRATITRTAARHRRS